MADVSIAAVLRPAEARAYRRPVDAYRYRLNDTTGDDLGTVEHPAPNVGPGDVLTRGDGREALATAGREGSRQLATPLEGRKSRRRRSRATTRSRTAPLSADLLGAGTGDRQPQRGGFAG